MMAEEIGLDGALGRRCGLLHDIGKAADHEMEGGHPAIGAELTKRYGEAKEVVHAALGHHDDLRAETPYTVLVAAADAISASRPGARRETLEKYVRRLEELEALACGFPGVEQAYAIQAGREIRVIADSHQLDDEAAAKLCRDIARAVQEQLTYPGEVKVTVLREIAERRVRPLSRSRPTTRDGSRALSRPTESSRGRCAMALKILFIGDVVGSPGRKIVSQVLPRLIRRWDLGLVVCNAENAAGGSGLTVRCHEELVEAGVDVFTLGDHVYRKDEVFNLFEQTDRLLRPANFPPDSPGEDVRAGRGQGRHARRRSSPCSAAPTCGRSTAPSARPTASWSGSAPTVKVILVDIHAEATSDKQLLGRYLDGRVSAVLGTHTHVATADEQILPGGTAYQTDVGMTGPHDSILGRRYDRVLAATLTFVPHYFDVATGDPRLNGALVEVDPATGRALAIRRVSIDAAETQRLLTESPP